MAPAGLGAFSPTLHPSFISLVRAHTRVRAALRQTYGRHLAVYAARRLRHGGMATAEEEGGKGHLREKRKDGHEGEGLTQQAPQLAAVKRYKQHLTLGGMSYVTSANRW